MKKIFAKYIVIEKIWQSMEKKLKNKRNNHKIIMGMLICAICFMCIYSFTKVVPVVYINENTNLRLLSVESMWWSPTGDFYYADSLIYILAKGKKIKVFSDCPYAQYLSVYVEELEEAKVCQPQMDMTDTDFQYIGKCDMKANRQLIDEAYMAKLSATDGIVGVYAHADSIADSNTVYVSVGVKGDIYLYGK